jgi:hypothetical protein
VLLFASLGPMATRVLPVCSATLGEISDALRDVWGVHVPNTSVVQGAYSVQYSQAESAAEFDNVRVLVCLDGKAVCFPALFHSPIPTFARLQRASLTLRRSMVVALAFWLPKWAKMVTIVVPR